MGGTLKLGRRPQVMMTVMLGAFAVLRVAASVRQPGVFPDSQTYAPLSFLGQQERLWTVPLLYNLLPANWLREAAQILIGVVAWSMLATTATPAVNDRRVGVAAMVAVLALGLTSQVMVWDADMLSESLSISLLVLICALMLRKRISGRLLAGLVLLATLWVFTRQENVVIYLFLLPVILVFAAWTLPRRIAAWLCIALVALGAWSGAELIGQTRPPADRVWTFNAAEVMVDRLSAQPAAMHYFAERGLPVALVEQAARLPNGPNVEWILHKPAFLRWVQQDFKRAYTSYLIAQMPTPLTQPFRVALTDATTMPQFYGQPRPVLPVAVAQLAWNADGLLIGTVLLIVLVAGCATLRARVRIGWLPPLLLLFVAVMIVVNYDFGSRELERLFVPGAVALRLAMVMLCARTLDALLHAKELKGHAVGRVTSKGRRHPESPAAVLPTKAR